MWDTTYRPLLFRDVLGQEGTVNTLKGRLAKGEGFGTSYIFGGGHGQGKTTLARILGRALLCLNLTAEQEPCNECENCFDTMRENSAALSEMNAASHGTVDNARQIVSDLPFVVQGAPKRIYIFDEVHRMTVGAQDVLLKPLEDKRLVGIFCTTEPNKIRGPIRSRCEEHLIRKITTDHILTRMKMILDKEGVKHEDDAVRAVIDHSLGHVRDVINKLEMFSQLGPITVSAVREGLNLSIVSTYYEILLSLNDPATSVRLAEEACDQVGPSDVAEGIAEAAMNSYRLAHNMGVDFAEIDRSLAARVHAMYGDQVTKFSEYFLRSYRITKISLLGDLIACQAGAPAQSTAAPVQITVSAPIVSGAPISVPSVTPASVPPAATSATVVVSTPAAPHAPAAQPEPAQRGELRHDGVGNLGSSDTAALTRLDKFGVPSQRPRMGNEAQKHPPGTPVNKRDNLLTAEEWKTKFHVRVQLLVKESG